jgi:Glutathione S-transferase, N-terminal domain
MNRIKVTAYRWVPQPAQGLVRDLRVRWALEEAGLAYDEQLIDFGDQSSESHRKLQPFGQIPVYEEDGLTLFESGAIDPADRRALARLDAIRCRRACARKAMDILGVKHD